MHDAWSAVSTSPISNLFLFFGGKVKLLKRSLHFHLFKKCLFRRELFSFHQNSCFDVSFLQILSISALMSCKDKCLSNYRSIQGLPPKTHGYIVIAIFVFTTHSGIFDQNPKLLENSKLALVSCSDALRGWVSNNSPNSESCTSTSPIFH